MHSETLPVDQLAVWAQLNNVDFNGVEVRSFEDRGSGLVATWESNANAVLISVPHDLILSLENVWVYAKADKHLLQALEAVEEYSRTPRGAILIFLLLQLTNASTQGSIGVLNPFSEYIRYIPQQDSLPIFWTDMERALLTGTSLEAAIRTKISSLDREFMLLREKTASIDWCKQYWWDAGSGSLSFDDWKQIDAFYRSRALDLPGTGHAVVPCVDMANHASGEMTAALYDTDDDGNGILYLRSGNKICPGDEVTITYGDDKGACEMLFSYGFIEATMTSAKELFLDLEIPDDDPLKPAKRAIPGVAPGFRLYFENRDEIGWDGDFVWLICINEEDGLAFKLLQNTDGETELQATWKEQEILDFTKLPDLLQKESLWNVLHLRAITVLQERVEQQLLRFEAGKKDVEVIWGYGKLDDRRYDNAVRLRDLEETLLLHAYEDFEDKKLELLESPNVQAYLNHVTIEQPVVPDEDFS